MSKDSTNTKADDIKSNNNEDDIKGNNNEDDIKADETVSAVAIDAATREILYGVMSLEERLQFGYKYAKNHPRYAENFQHSRKQPFKLGKPTRKYVSSSDSDSSSESSSDSDSVDAVKSKSRRIRSFIDDEPRLNSKSKSKSNELSDKQKVLLKEICNIPTIDVQLDAIGISRNDFSESNIMLILSVIDSIVSSNMLSKEENIKIKKLLDEIKRN